jgi:hypothetical protein
VNRQVLWDSIQWLSVKTVYYSSTSLLFVSENLPLKRVRLCAGYPAVAPALRSPEILLEVDLQKEHVSSSHLPSHRCKAVLSDLLPRARPLFLDCFQSVGFGHPSTNVLPISVISTNEWSTVRATRGVRRLNCGTEPPSDNDV